jgi:hypothetical protein
VFTHAGFWRRTRRTTARRRFCAARSSRSRCCADRSRRRRLTRPAPALPPASADLNTNRKQVAAQTEVAGTSCAGCHAPVVNPPGFALESYDSIGQWQTDEKGTGAAIDSTGRRSPSAARPST